MTYQKLIKNEEREEGFVKKKKLRNILKPSPRNYLKIGMEIKILDITFF